MEHLFVSFKVKREHIDDAKKIIIETILKIAYIQLLSIIFATYSDV